ncbi:prepilin peptidase [Ignatzschineria sp. LJL83]
MLVLDLFLILTFPVVVLSLFYWLWVIRIEANVRSRMIDRQRSIQRIYWSDHFAKMYRFYGLKIFFFGYCSLLFVMSCWYGVLKFYGVSQILFVDVVFLISVIVLMMFDTRYYLLPNPLVYLLLWSGVLMSLLGYGLISLEISILGVVWLYLIMWGVSKVGRLYYRKEALGRGDFKYAAAIGAWIGVDYISVFLFLSASLGALYGISMQYFVIEKQREIIPFGPFLGFSGIIIYFLLKLF